MCVQEHDLKFNEHGVMVLGCGPYHIGRSRKLTLKCFKGLVSGFQDSYIILLLLILFCERSDEKKFVTYTSAVNKSKLIHIHQRLQRYLTD